jgi:hypothetical protein
LMGPAHFSTSRRVNWPRYSGLRRSGGATVTPTLANRSRTDGISTTSLHRLPQIPLATPAFPKSRCGVPSICAIPSRLNSQLIARRAKIMVSVRTWFACSYCSSSLPSWDHVPALGTTYRIGPAAYRKTRPLGRAPPNTMRIDRNRMQKLLATRATIPRKQNPIPHCRNRAAVPGAPKGVPESGHCVSLFTAFPWTTWVHAAAATFIRRNEVVESSHENSRTRCVNSRVVSGGLACDL